MGHRENEQDSTLSKHFFLLSVVRMHNAAFPVMAQDCRIYALLQKLLISAPNLSL